MCGLAVWLPRTTAVRIWVPVSVGTCVHFSWTHAWEWTCWVLWEFSACLLCVSLPAPPHRDLASCRGTDFSTCPVPGWHSTHTKGTHTIVMKWMSSRTLPIGPTFGKELSWFLGSGGWCHPGESSIRLGDPLSPETPVHPRAQDFGWQRLFQRDRK